MAKNFAQSKGLRGELEVVKLLQPVVTKVCMELGWPTEKIPKLERNLTQCRSGGQDIAGLDWLALEVKRQETLNLKSWWVQCKQQAGSSKEPVLIYRQNNAKWEIRMFGLLPVEEKHVRCPVDISLEAFLVYFEMRVKYELTKSN